MAGPLEEIPPGVDFHDPRQARTWVADTVASRPWRAAFFAAFASTLNAELGRGAAIVELGSGPGHLAAVLLERCQPRSYTAIDFSAAMHDLAQQHLGAAADRVTFLLRDFRRPDWTAGLDGVDAVVTMQAAHEVRHKTRLPALLASVHAVLRPGGLLLFCDHYAGTQTGKRRELALERDEQARALEAAGFASVTLLRDEGSMALYSGRRPVG